MLAAAVVFGTGVWQGASASPIVIAALSVGVAAPLALRRKLPLAAAIASAVVVLCGAPVPGWSGKLVAMAAFCSAAYYCSHRVALVFAASVSWLLAYALVLPVGPLDTALFSDAVITGIAPVAVGYAMRLHRDRAEQAARLHQAEASRVVAEERSRIAREVHDAVGHHLTAIRLQVGAATYALGGIPPAAGTAFRTIDDLAATALAEVRELLETLREDDDLTGSTLADVAALADRLTTSDCPVVLSWHGPVRTLPPLVEHGGYRLAQEALTNAVRHADAGEIRVAIRYESEAVIITVEDDGPSRDLVVEGQGIRGMRERAHLLGGTLRITPRHPHGWLVQAALPTERATR
ncbi:sensor histidine kinase [Saccharopolyspora sp. K220]|uniref:sensor histidine kinase n=1 Tax=Saccharopolyspora soli TaxID=2926618 RepID=UPI001F58ABB3|nr:sensor histidine kinase [Saccharopolyspora soli]MCI2417811.1 sensor histidine kinase [Saccharopolyspora soli]